MTRALREELQRNCWAAGIKQWPLQVILSAVSAPTGRKRGEAVAGNEDKLGKG